MNAEDIESFNISKMSSYPFFLPELKLVYHYFSEQEFNQEEQLVGYHNILTEEFSEQINNPSVLALSAVNVLKIFKDKSLLEDFLLDQKEKFSKALEIYQLDKMMSVDENVDILEYSNTTSNRLGILFEYMKSVLTGYSKRNYIVRFWGKHKSSYFMFIKFLNRDALNNTKKNPFVNNTRYTSNIVDDNKQNKDIFDYLNSTNIYYNSLNNINTSPENYILILDEDINSLNPRLNLKLFCSKKNIDNILKIKKYMKEVKDKDLQSLIENNPYLSKTLLEKQSFPDLVNIIINLNKYFELKSLDHFKFNIQTLQKFNENKLTNTNKFISSLPNPSLSFSYSSEIKNYEFIDFDNLNKSLPFTIEEFDEVRAITPITLKQKYPNFVTTFEELGQRVETNFENKKTYIDKYMLARYAVGFSGNTERAWNFLLDFINFKEDYIVNKLGYSLNVIPKNIQSTLIQNFGSDIYGRPILFVQAKLFNPKEIEKDVLVDYLMTFLERNIQNLPKNIDKCSMIVDFHGIGSTNFSIPHLKAVQEGTNKYYVERMANIIIINKGMFFGFVWKIISGFLPERVLKKIIIVDEAKKPYLKKILGHLYDKLVFK